MGPPGLNHPAEVDQILADFWSMDRFCRRVNVRRKTGELTPLILSAGQKRVVEAYERQRRAGKPVRLFIGPKPRQAFFSTIVAALIFRDCAFIPGQQAQVMADVHKTNENLWNYYRLLSESYDGRGGIAQLRSLGGTRNQKLLWEGGSKIDFASAERETGGRSFTFRHVHCSEYAFWRNAAPLMTGLHNSVPNDPLTSFYIESTANGWGTPHHEFYQRVMDVTRSSEWLAVFVAWFEHPEYRMALADADKLRLSRTLDAEERHLQEQFGVTLEQLAWRRWKIENDCEGSVHRFHQEYPSTPEEAFLSSGRPRFDRAVVMRQPVVRNGANEAGWISGELQQREVGTRLQLQFVPREDGRGMLRVLRRPVAMDTRLARTAGRYVIGVDPAQGIDPGINAGKDSDPDYTAASVHDLDTGEQIAVLRGRLEPAAAAEYVAALARWYNMAYVVPEAVGNGVAFLSHLVGQYPEYLIYARDRQADDVRSARLQELGYKTSNVTRPQLVSALDEALRTGTVIIRDPATLQELLAFVVKANGKAEAEEGAHDDLVFAAALAVVGLEKGFDVFAAVRRREQAEREARRPFRYNSKRPASDDDDDDDGGERMIRW